jgi:hypothetical protein
MARQVHRETVERPDVAIAESAVLDQPAKANIRDDANEVFYVLERTATFTSAGGSREVTTSC